MLYVFSDGVYEITTHSGSDWDLEDFVEIMRAPLAPGTTETQRLLKAVRASARSPSLEDDFSLMAFTFTPAASRLADSTWPNRG
jgi:sigma-B regulation protein RsbU (phosphoserine phosphatase)